MLNSRDIDRLRPDVAANCRAWLELCRAAGLLVLVTGTVRDDEYQRYCYEQGTAATPYPSFHGERAGLAFDFCQNIKGQEYSDASFFQRAGELGERALSGAADGRVSLTGRISSGAPAAGTPAPWCGRAAIRPPCHYIDRRTPT